ncbi:hypothetical protein EDC96DRAFT_522626 [Choanephora cucurbitarum]|nr:hypothetical protein EDC96DRAFT_522626 [Choanephora cucurbitarum]
MADQDSYLSCHDNVQDWLMDIPDYPDNCLHVHSNKTRQRPCSIASISSEDSISLDELINANFTTNMADETDLTELAALELDDSKEEFWKVDNYSNHFIPAQFSGKKEPSYHGSNRSNYDVNHFDIAVNEHEFISKLNLSDNTPFYDYHVGAKSSRLQSPKDHRKWDRSNSDISLHSQSTATRGSRLHLSASTSTSSSSTASSSVTSRSAPLDHKSVASRRKSSLIHPEGQSDARPRTSQLAKRASSISVHHALSPLAKPGNAPPIPQRTKSTIVTNPQHGSISRLSQLSRRASHIPAPSSRSNSSLGMTSMFASQSKQIRPRPQTSLDFPHPTASTARLSRTVSLIGVPTPSKSTAGLRRFGLKQ